jgi:hypothetical protein
MVTNGSSMKSDTGGEPSPVDPFEPENASEAVRAIPRYLSELAEYAGHFVGAKLDLVKLSVRNLFLVAFVWLLGGLTAVAVIGTSVVLLMIGIARGLGVLFGGREWLGDLVVGLVVTGGFGAFVLFVFAKLKVFARLKTVRKYEAAREQQRQRFGRDVADGAAAAGRVAN